MSELKSEIGKRIAQIRKNAGDTQETCAKKLGIKRGTLAAYEKGINATPDEIKQCFSTLYDVSVQYLLSGTQYLEDPGESYRKTNLLTLLESLDPTTSNQMIIRKVHELLEENKQQKDKIIELLEKLNDISNP